MIKTKKKWGQHLLKYNVIGKKIIGLLLPSDSILMEIGAGTGALTSLFSLEQQKRLHIIEIDNEMIEILQKKCPFLSQSQIIYGDFLSFIFPDKWGKDITIIGNFPYNITSQIIFKIIENRKKIKEVVCMVQHEVAKRLASSFGGKMYGKLSVALQTFYKVTFCFSVSPTCFSPPPKVISSVITLHRKNEFNIQNEKNWWKIIKIAFSERRKMLKNIFKKYFKNIKTPERFASKRAEQLSPKDFFLLYKHISQHQTIPTGDSLKKQE